MNEQPKKKDESIINKYMISEINDPKSKHASYFEELYADTAIVESEDTDFLKKYGEESIRTGKPIVYTSADSVLQICG